MRSVLRHKYDFVCSIGHYCATAMYLKRHQLRTASYPLDWVGKGPDGFVTHMGLVSGDFRGLLASPEALVRKVNRRVRKVDDLRHDYYLDSGTGMLCYHDFPTGVPLKRSFPHVRSKYDRRIARFYETVRASRRTLLVYQTCYERLEDGLILGKMEEIRRRLAPARVDLLVIEDRCGKPVVEITEPGDGVYHAIGWFFKPEVNAVLGDMRLCDRVYAQIRCRGAAGRRLRGSLVRGWIRFLAAFHRTSRRRSVAWRVLSRRYAQAGLI